MASRPVKPSELEPLREARELRLELELPPELRLELELPPELRLEPELPPELRLEPELLEELRREPELPELPLVPDFLAVRLDREALALRPELELLDPLAELELPEPRPELDPPELRRLELRFDPLPDPELRLEPELLLLSFSAKFELLRLVCGGPRLGDGQALHQPLLLRFSLFGRQTAIVGVKLQLEQVPLDERGVIQLPVGFLGHLLHHPGDSAHGGKR